MAQAKKHDYKLVENLEIETETTSINKASPTPEAMDYKFLDGLRGIGAFVVYIGHFLQNFYLIKREDEEDIKLLPSFMRTTPITVLYLGLFWVYVFFILSGFVLTLRFYKTRKTTCVSGGTFRRYMRLMIPLWINLSLYFIAFKFGLLGDNGHDLKNESFL